MKEGDFFDLIDDPGICDAAYEYLFSLSDRVRYLGCYRMERDITEELLASPYEGVLSSVLCAERGNDWNMEGTYLSFALSEPVKRMVKENTLGGMVPVCTVKERGREEGVFLENLSLWKGEKRLYAVCSHEGYTDADEDFSAAVGRFCLEKIAGAERYAAMKEKFAALSPLPEHVQRDGFSVLFYLPCYVSEAGGDLIYQAPPRACSYEEFLGIAERFLTADVCETLKSAGSFANLHPSAASGGAVSSSGEFRNSPLAEQIRGELRMLEAVSFRETGNVVFGGGGGAPTIVIREKKR